MKSNNLFSIGQPVGMYEFACVPVFKVSQLEKTMLIGDKRYVIGRIIASKDIYSSDLISKDNIYVMTVNGLIMPINKKDVILEPRLKMESFLMKEEFFVLVRKGKPYNDKLIKNEDGDWYTQL